MTLGGILAIPSEPLEARNLFSCGFVRPQVVMSFEHS